MSSNFDPAHPDSIFGYLKVFTTNLAHDHFKSLNAKKRGQAITTELTDEAYRKHSPPGALPVGTGAAENPVLMQQIDEILRTEAGPNATRDRRIFWLYYRVGFTASAISAIPDIGLNTKGVESTILRLTRRVRAFLAARPGRTEMKSEGSARKGFQPADSF